MGTALKFESNKNWSCSPKIFSSNMCLTKETDEVESETLNNNMAEAVYRSLEQASVQTSTSAGESKPDSGQSSKLESKPKQTNFSIRSLLDEELKSPSDSGYGSGSPSPNESVFRADTPEKSDNDWEKNFSSVNFPSLSSNCGTFLTSSKQNSQNESSAVPSTCNKSSLFPLEYQNLLYAMNLKFLERQDKALINSTAGSIFKDPTNFSKSSSTFSRSFLNRNILNDHLTSKKNEKPLISLSKDPSLEEKQNCNMKSQSFFQTKTSEQKEQRQSDGDSKQTSDFKMRWNRLARNPLPFEVVNSTLGTSQPSAEQKNNYLQQMSKLWWENAIKSPGGSANSPLVRHFMNPAYYHRLQMFFAASAAAAASGHVPNYTCCNSVPTANAYAFPGKNNLNYTAHCDARKRERKGKFCSKTSYVFSSSLQLSCCCT